VGPNFFETLGIPLLLGRTIGEGDTEGTPRVGVVNEQFVRQFLGSGNPVGQRFGFGDQTNSGDMEIVGLVGDAKYDNLRKEVSPTIYVAGMQDLKSLGSMHFEVRTAGNPMELASPVRRVAQDMDRNLALYDVRTQIEQINKTLFQERLFARLTSLFGVLAGLLACVGVYGTVSFAVTRRTREIGIRMALGAGKYNVFTLVIGQGMRLTLAGVVVGVLLALAATRVLGGLLYDVKPTDPLTFGLMTLLMISVALLACLIPACRATKVDPMEALRYE